MKSRSLCSGCLRTDRHLVSKQRNHTHHARALTHGATYRWLNSSARQVLGVSEGVATRVGGVGEVEGGAGCSRGGGGGAKTSERTWTKQDYQ